MQKLKKVNYLYTYIYLIYINIIPKKSLEKNVDFSVESI